MDIQAHRMLEDEEVEPVDVSAVNGETEPGAGGVDEMEEIQQLTEILDMDDNDNGEDIAVAKPARLFTPAMLIF